MSKIIHITESQLNHIIGEMAYPASFDFDEFRKLNTFAQRIQYCETHLKRLSSGSSRIVYIVDDDKVLKLAKNQKGLAQNKTEIKLGTEPYYTCFAEIYEYDENGLWVEMEYCRKAKKSDFKKIYGVPFEVLLCMIYDFVGWKCNGYNPYREHRKLLDEVWQQYDGDTLEFFNSIQEYLGGEGLNSIGDLCRINSWGINHEGYFILIDYGLDDDIFNKFYKRR